MGRTNIVLPFCALGYWIPTCIFFQVIVISKSKPFSAQKTPDWSEKSHSRRLQPHKPMKGNSY